MNDETLEQAIEAYAKPASKRNREAVAAALGVELKEPKPSYAVHDANAVIRRSRGITDEECNGCGGTTTAVVALRDD